MPPVKSLDYPKSISTSFQDISSPNAVDTISYDVSNLCSKNSQFLINDDEKYDVGNGVVLCRDQILYGYDLLFENLKLFTFNTWLGVPNQQDPLDSLIIAELIYQEKPDVIIELGTNEGGGALFYASILELSDIHSDSQTKKRVITIDPNHYREGGWIPNKRCLEKSIKCIKVDESPIWSKRVSFVQGYPHEIINIIKTMLTPEDKIVWVIEDSNHNYNTVLINLDLYAPLVTNGGLLLVQDTKLTRFHCGLDSKACLEGVGPMMAAQDFLKHHNEFYVDRSPEYFLYTQHAKGWLRRKSEDSGLQHT